MTGTRRRFLAGSGAAVLTTAIGGQVFAGGKIRPAHARLFKFAHIDVFTSTPLLGNPLDVFLDARGMSDAEMLAVTRESYLNEVTFIFPRDATTEREQGIHVRIFTPDGEVPFAGHPTLGTASVLHAQRLKAASQNKKASAGLDDITLDLKIGKVPVKFLRDNSGHVLGEMRQVAPVFGEIHDRDDVAQLHNLSPDDIADWAPIQTVSTGLPFTILPLKRLSSLQSLRLNEDKLNAYAAKRARDFGFYYVTRDTAEPDIALRARCIYVGGEDAATGSAAGCTAAWMVRHGAAQSDQSVHIRQGVEMKRTSDIFVRASLDRDTVSNVRVAGYTVQTMQGELTL